MDQNNNKKTMVTETKNPRQYQKERGQVCVLGEFSIGKAT